MKLAVIAGDGIGPEVIDQALRVARKLEPELTTTDYDFGARRYHATGELLTDADLASLREHDAILLGAIGDPSVPSGVLERGFLLKLRFAMDHHVNLRPSILFDGVQSPLAGNPKIDFVVVREGTEGPYTGNGGAIRVGTPHEVATEVSVNTRYGIERVVRDAFARAQARKVPTIGFLGASTSSAWRPWVAAFVQRLGELGWTERRTVEIEYRWAEGRSERFAQFAAELVKLKVDVVVTGGSAVLAVKRETSTLPIVFALASDPLGMGLVESLARPGGNATGLSQQAVDTVSKRVALLREVVPDMSRLGVLANVGNPELREVQAAAIAMGLEVIPSEITRAVDIDAAFDTFKHRANALYVCSTDPLVHANQVRINTLASAARLPTIYGSFEYVESGGLMSYGSNVPDLFRRAAEFVDKILRGAKPSEIPVEQPTKFDLALNQTTATAIGLVIPSRLLFTANQVIE